MITEDAGEVGPSTGGGREVECAGLGDVAVDDDQHVCVHSRYPSVSKHKHLGHVP